MFLSLATYFETNDPWLIDLRPWWDVLMFSMSIPVVFFSASDYFIQSRKSLLHKVGSLEVPIALGITVLFLKSIHNAFVLGTLPYFDSLCGLVFFLLLGKYMQSRVYESFSFERDYKSFFSLAVRLLTADKKEKTVDVNEIKKGDQIILKPGEVIPVDAKVVHSSMVVDYSFVTGESRWAKQAQDTKNRRRCLLGKKKLPHWAAFKCLLLFNVGVLLPLLLKEYVAEQNPLHVRV